MAVRPAGGKATGEQPEISGPLAGGRACLAILALVHALAGCMATSEDMAGAAPEREGPAAAQTAALTVDPKEKECLVRAMYFESNRSSEEGLLGVGTVVMNRLASPDYPDTICEVVGQPRQFADGVLTKPMSSTALPQIEKVADDVLAGKRHDDVGIAMHFHTEGYTFPYRNMHYVAVAGGNAFYEKRRPDMFEGNQALLAESVPLPRRRPAEAGLPIMNAYSGNDALSRHAAEATSRSGMGTRTEDQP